MMPRSLSMVVLGGLLSTVACTSPAARRSAAIDEAEAATANGDLARAEKILANALGYDPRDIQIATKLAEVHVQGESFWQALQVLDGVPRDVPRPPHYLNLRARLLGRFKRVDEALRILQALQAAGQAEEKTVEVVLKTLGNEGCGPDDEMGIPADWSATVAGHQIKRGELESAAEWLDLLPDGHPQKGKLADELLELILQDGTTSVGDKIVKLAQAADTPAKMLVLRRHLLAVKNWPAAASIEERFLSEHPDHMTWSEIALSSAERHIRVGNADSAIGLADRAAFLDPRNVQALVIRGLALKKLGRTKEAQQAFETAVALDPSNEQAQTALAAPKKQASSIQIDLDVHGTSARLP